MVYNNDGGIGIEKNKEKRSIPVFTGALNKHLHIKSFIKINIQGRQRPDT